MIPAQAQLAYQAKVATFEVFDAAPGEIARLLAGKTCEVALLDQRNLRAFARKRRRSHRAIDSAADDQCVEYSLIELFNVAFAKLHISLNFRADPMLLTSASVPEVAPLSGTKRQRRGF